MERWLDRQAGSTVRYKHCKHLNYLYIDRDSSLTDPWKYGWFQIFGIPNVATYVTGQINSTEPVLLENLTKYYTQLRKNFLLFIEAEGLFPPP
jgi:hypothetical protein